MDKKLKKLTAFIADLNKVTSIHWTQGLLIIHDDQLMVDRETDGGLIKFDQTIDGQETTFVMGKIDEEMLIGETDKTGDIILAAALLQRDQDRTIRTKLLLEDGALVRGFSKTSVDNPKIKVPPMAWEFFDKVFGQSRDDGEVIEIDGELISFAQSSVIDHVLQGHQQDKFPTVGDVLKAAEDNILPGYTVDEKIDKQPIPAE